MNAIHCVVCCSVPPAVNSSPLIVSLTLISSKFIYSKSSPSPLATNQNTNLTDKTFFPNKNSTKLVEIYEFTVICTFTDELIAHLYFS